MQDTDGVLEMVSEEEEGRCIFESSSAHECVRVLQCSSFPSLFGEIIGKKAVGCTLFTRPSSHAPKTDEDCLFPESQVVKRAVDRVLLFGFGIFVSSDDFELSALGMWLVSKSGYSITLLYQCVDVGHPHEHSAFLCVLPHHLAAEMSTDKVNEDILAS